MKVLVACEYSGVMRDAFRAQGHDAWSCDLRPSEADSRWHIQGDVVPLLKRGWDLLIAFPPSTYLANAGLNWNKNPNHPRGKMRPDGMTEGEAQAELALAFVSTLLNAPVPRICLENPVGLISSRNRSPDQIVHPWQFGTPEARRTGLWLKNLPPLTPTDVLARPKSGRWANQTPSGGSKVGFGKERWKVRAKPLPGMAEAMATQWGRLGPVARRA